MNEIIDANGIVEDVELSFSLICIKCGKKFSKNLPYRRCNDCFDFTLLKTSIRPIITKFVKVIHYNTDRSLEKHNIKKEKKE